jgi:hypothetical protein
VGWFQISPPGDSCTHRFECRISALINDTQGKKGVFRQYRKKSLKSVARSVIYLASTSNIDISRHFCTSLSLPFALNSAVFLRELILHPFSSLTFSDVRLFLPRWEIREQRHTVFRTNLWVSLNLVEC